MADVSRAGPKGSHARSEPWELPSSGGGQWRASVSEQPAGNERSHEGERRRATLRGDVGSGGQARDERGSNSSRIAPDFGGEAEAVTRAANARDFERDGRERRGLCGVVARRLPLHARQAARMYDA